MANFPRLSKIFAALLIISSKLIFISWRAIVKNSLSFKLLSSSTLKKGGLHTTNPTFMESFTNSLISLWTIFIWLSKLFNVIFFFANSTASFWISTPIIG